MKRINKASRTFALGAVAVLFLASTSDAQSEQHSESVWARGHDNFSYTYLQLGAGFGTKSDNQSFDLIQGRAMVGLGKHMYLRGDAVGTDNSDQNETLMNYSLSVGAHGSLSERLDFMIDAGYVSSSVDSGGASMDSDGAMLGVGVRGMSPEQTFEAEFRYTHRWLAADSGSSSDNGDLGFELLWRVHDNVGVYVGGTWESSNGETIGAYGLGLRVSL